MQDSPLNTAIAIMLGQQPPPDQAVTLILHLLSQDKRATDRVLAGLRRIEGKGTILDQEC